ncbi:MAG: tetratricopeptide repeat protein [Pirellulaceae bacterium]
MSIPKLRQYQAHRNTRHAQGLLELICCCDDLWGIDGALKQRIAEQALTILRQSRPVGSSRAHWLYVRGKALSITEHHRAAIKSFRASLKMDPTRIAGYLSLAWCLKRIDRVDQSILVLNKALKRSPQHAKIRFNQACYLSLAGQPHLAATELAIALELDPSLRWKVSTERDFDPIRHHPAFDAALQVIV